MPLSDQLYLQHHPSTTDEEIQRQTLKVSSCLDASKDMWSQNITFGNTSTRCLTMQKSSANMDHTHFVVHSLKRTSTLDTAEHNIDLDIEWSCLDRR